MPNSPPTLTSARSRPIDRYALESRLPRLRSGFLFLGLLLGDLLVEFIGLAFDRERFLPLALVE